ncbi:MAG: DmsE family decaheme c-type cytochrome [Pseudomonadota bacterium]
MLLAGPARAQAPGPEACANCHEAQVKSFDASKHGTKADSRTPVNAGGCAVCHGDATEHVKAGGGRGVGGIWNPRSKTISAERKNGLCLTCHQGGKRIHWERSAHAASEVSCTSCHELHAPHDRARDKLAQSEICFACHKEQRAQMSRPSRHPIKEGKVACSDCHNPHGTAGPKQLVRDDVNDTCYQCHMEKRGPFVRTHQPVQEDCTICHSPHGTTNPNLLKVRAPFLCQACHQPTSHHATVPQDGVTTAAPTTNQAVIMARGCVNCHTNIHGSNNANDNATGRGFRR